MAYILLHALALLALGAAVALAGAAVLPWIADGGRPSARRAAVFLVGALYWMAALFALAAAGWLTRGGLVVALVPPAAAALARRRAPFLPSPAERTPPAGTTLDRLAAAGVAAVLLPQFLLALTPVVSWDAAVYHLTLPRLYVEHGGFRPVAMNVYSLWPQGVELLFAGALLVQDFVLAKLVHFGFGLLVVVTVWTAARSRAGAEARLAGWLAAALFLANPVVAQELRVAYVDLAQAFFLLCGVLLMERALDAPSPERARSALLLAGLAGGALAASKVTGLAGAAVVGALALPRLLRPAADGRGRLPWSAFLSRFALPTLLLWLPWPVRAWRATGNPFYPFFWDRFGGPDWSAGLTARLADWQRSIGMGRDLTDYLLLPFRVVLSGGEGYARFDGRLGELWLAVVPLALVVARRRAELRRPLVAAALAFLLWAAGPQQMRLLLPALPLLALAGGVALADVVARRRGRRLARAAVLVAALALAVRAHATPIAAGVRSAAAFARFDGDLLATGVPPADRFVNDSLPPDAVLLMVNESRRFFCRREALADSFFEASQIHLWLGDAADAGEAARRLAVRGVTHVLVRRPDLAPGVPPALAALLADAGRAERLWVSPDRAVTVWALRLAPEVGR